MLASINPTCPAPDAVARPRHRHSFVARVLSALALHRQRRHLAELDDAMLDDIGLTRETALKEASRPVWDAPGHWLR